MAEDRDPKGRFVKGNKQGLGNPLGKKTEALRFALYQAISPEDIKAIAGQLKKKAKSGDLKAIGILLDRLLGPPVQPDILERITELERIISEENENEY